MNHLLNIIFAKQSALELGRKNFIRKIRLVEENVIRHDNDIIEKKKSKEISS